MKKADGKINMSDIMVSAALGGFVTLGAITLMEPVSVDHDVVVWIAAILGSMTTALIIVLIRKMKREG